MKKILADFKRYNANSNNKNVGDCVKRSLSYAYGADYDEISRQLNRIKNDIGAFAYNNSRVWTKFLQDHQAEQLSKDGNTGMTEYEFTESHPTGIYILLTGPEKKDYSTHMVCIMNGDIIDSWDSSNYIVRSAWRIPNVTTDTFEVTWDDIADELNSFIDAYIETVNKKADGWFEVWREDGYRVNPQTYRMLFYVRVGDVPKDSNFYPFKKYQKRIVVKINPRLDLEQNIASLKPKLKQRVYDFVYEFQKDKRDTEAIQNMDIHPRMYNDSYAKKDLLKLPEWCRKYVRYFWVNTQQGNGWTNYELKMDALPDDPDKGAYPTVSIESDSLKELKKMLEEYRKDYSRPGRDY